ncbi:MAG: hypothetical protein A2X17_06230 [Bacteroidetes bacterium GWF2_41_61]|nr:MAG: hypothetical protein A2X20_12130 [Bacteroidetes bacterium GWE2_40_15]OFY35899.1 MAG: hypothetical protein A2X17_06230 [Bacteroidetes bacterium GWF2_41_61]OFY89281.1 MAG: hypothetical protein A2266_06970 [Bacteroidetes bacterium RIFOXYA12_FULL_40_10]HBG24044.1 hypothetical protein [Rikenellaceae bacterium]
MKIEKYIYSAAALLLMIVYTSPVLSQSRVTERLYLSTDRSSYIAGEDLWISGYCLDVTNSVKLSPLSSVAYIELHNVSSVVLTAKILLVNGRGSGHINLPPNLPTGNYRVVAYTKYMLNEERPNLFVKDISIYNVLSNEKVPGNVVVEETDNTTRQNEADQTPRIGGSSHQSIAGASNLSSVEIKFGVGGRVVPANSSFPIKLVNNGSDLITANISVVKIDSLSALSGSSFHKYATPVNGKTPVMTDKYIPEFEGEIIYGRVNHESDLSLEDKVVFLSAVGRGSDIYSSFIDNNGSFKFFTNSIFGEREIVLQIPNSDSNSLFTYEIFDPFVRSKNGDIPKLILTKRVESTLNERGIEMQIGRRFGVDTLYERIPVDKDPLLKKNPIVYKLDDYTRFPVMSEVVIEYVPELRFRRLDGIRDLQMRLEEGFNLLSFSRANTLVLIDGIPIFDHNKLYNYDPLKVKTLSIYPSQYFIGISSFDGVASFQTYKGDYPGLTFSKNVRILDFQGLLYPTKTVASKIPEIKNFPDMRSLLYWDPQMELAPSVNPEFFIHTSSLPGTYRITIEGISSKGDVIEFYTEFAVK